MKPKKLTSNLPPAEPNAPEDRTSPVVSGGTSENIGDHGSEHQANNANRQEKQQAKPSDNSPAKQAPPQTISGRFQPGQSGNPKGRPKGSPNKSTHAARAILESSAPQLLAKTIELALAGNATALKLCFDRIVPQQRAVHLARLAKLSTKTKETESVLAAHNAVLEAVANGEITPHEGQSVSAIVDARRRSWESMEIEEQIADLQDSVDDA